MIDLIKKEKLTIPEDSPMCMVKKIIIVAQQKSESGKIITDWDIHITAHANIGAGSDTTSLGLSTVLYYLYRNPLSLEKLRKDIKWQNLSYLQAAIKEAPRMPPGTGLPLWRKVPEGKMTICDLFSKRIRSSIKTEQYMEKMPISIDLTAGSKLLPIVTKPHPN
ncbi:hypothetical protein BGW36DRAFT_358292 [Talaromyces proteolyticus]|uniref:Cytochrome P450 n=1 Tax=Talaromyces proteolyticus TaxID=1131652 RepID=A0AAD4Q1J2_9EURO|nr:uncharacterized protein BGW36DRAFT_358292 [Talaromyces proteolyticus]KAH8698774.1 hypothetical protein BGW36DRAFT_358292 [Talaromyces proteolyticus]